MARVTHATSLIVTSICQGGGALPALAKNSASHISDRYDHDVDGEPGRRWLTLTAGTIALTAGCTFQYGLAYLIPALRASGLSREEAGGMLGGPPPALALSLCGLW